MKQKEGEKIEEKMSKKMEKEGKFRPEENIFPKNRIKWNKIQEPEPEDEDHEKRKRKKKK